MKNLTNSKGLFFTFIFFMLTFLLSSQSADVDLTRAQKIRKDFLNADSERIIVVAHRGGWRVAPENSIDSIKVCIEGNIDVVEIDIRLTKDGIPILMHDTTLNRTTTGRGNVSDFTLAEIKKLFLKTYLGRKTEHRVPTLEEALIVAKDQILINLDKSYNIIKEIEPILIKTETLRQVILKGGDSPEGIADYEKSLNPDLIFMPVLYLRNYKEPSDELVNKYLELTNIKAFEFVFARSHYKAISPLYLSSLKKRGVRPWVNSLFWVHNAGHSDPKTKCGHASWDWLIDRGFTIIQSDRPFNLVKYLEKSNNRKQY